jgi:hypothetical protein
MIERSIYEQLGWKPELIKEAMRIAESVERVTSEIERALPAHSARPASYGTSASVFVSEPVTSSSLVLK